MAAAKVKLLIEANTTFAFAFKYKPGFVDEYDGDGDETTFDLSFDLTQNHKVLVNGIFVPDTKFTLLRGTGPDGVDQLDFATAPVVGAGNVKLIYNYPKDLSGATGKMHIRRTKDSPDFEFELTDDNDKIIFGAARGLITLTLPVSDTSTIDWEDGVYDLFITEGVVAKKILKGPVDTESSVTR